MDNDGKVDFVLCSAPQLVSFDCSAALVCFINKNLIILLLSLRFLYSCTFLYSSYLIFLIGFFSLRCLLLHLQVFLFSFFFREQFYSFLIQLWMLVFLNIKDAQAAWPKPSPSTHGRLMKSCTLKLFRHN